MFRSPCFYSTQEKQLYLKIAYWICSITSYPLCAHLGSTCTPGEWIHDISVLFARLGYQGAHNRCILGYTIHAKWCTKSSNLSFFLHFALDALIFLQTHSSFRHHLSTLSPWSLTTTLALFQMLVAHLTSQKQPIILNVKLKDEKNRAQTQKVFHFEIIT